MTRKQAIPYISHIINDALHVDDGLTLSPDARLVGWQCGFEPMFIAVQSYIPGVVIDASDAEDIAIEYLVERGWFGKDGPSEAEYIF